MKTIMIKTALILTLMSGFALGLSPDRSSATDVKSFPAAICQTVPGGKGIAMYGYNGEVYNRHPSKSLTVYCPLVRDVMGSTKGLYYLGVALDDQHPTFNPVCYLYYFDPVSFTRKEIRLQKKKGSSIFKYSASPNPETVRKELTTYTVLCTIPPKSGSSVSRLRSISYQEYD